VQCIGAAYLGLSEGLLAQGRITEALRYGELALDKSSKMTAAEPTNVDDQGQLAEIYSSLGDIHEARAAQPGAAPEMSRSEITEGAGLYEKVDELYSQLRARATRYGSVGLRRRKHAPVR
jgi:hypothetical protein